MDRLPPELFVAVCELLDKKDIANVRLLSKSACQLATPFLMSEVRLIFKPESFARLVAISKHPIISQQITAIFYEPDTLAKMERESWEDSLISDDYLGSKPTWLPPTATEEERQLFERIRDEHSRRMRHECSKKRLEEGWAQYQRYYREQQDLIRQRYACKDIQEAVACLPNVKEFRMSLGNSLETISGYLQDAFSAGFCGPFGDGHGGHAPGVPQLQSMLLSLHNAGIKLQTFECGDVSWKLFRCPKGSLKAFAAVLSQVRRFVLQISTGYDDGKDRIGAELPECRRFLKNGRIRDLIDPANDIVHLEIIFDWWDPVFAVDLVDLVGSRVWPNLASVAFSCIEASEDQLVQFLQRHKATLRSLHLDTMCLTSGEWPSLLPRIRSSLQLTEFLLEGHLYSDFPRMEFDLLMQGMESWDDRRLPEDVPRIEKREAVQAWFREGGDCPFTDEWSLYP